MFYDTESKRIVSESELAMEYFNEFHFEEYPNFNTWLNEISGKNGTLDEIRETTENNHRALAEQIVDTILFYDSFCGDRDDMIESTVKMLSSADGCKNIITELCGIIRESCE